jgi:hypothetical protein
LTYSKDDALEQLSKMMDGYANAIANIEAQLTAPDLTGPAKQKLDETMSYAQASWNAMSLASLALVQAPEGFALNVTAAEVMQLTNAQREADQQAAVKLTQDSLEPAIDATAQAIAEGHPVADVGSGLPPRETLN